MAQGSQHGISNNPAGRPPGAGQKITISVRGNIVKQIEDDIDRFFAELNALQGRDYVRAFTELLKLVIPRPLNEEETDVMNSNSELIRRLFGN